jgi:hypothetical protein
LINRDGDARFPGPTDEFPAGAENSLRLTGTKFEQFTATH